MSKPRLLDLFCGAGGAAMGYHRAGFEVVGIDIKPQPNYPFEFYRGDALDTFENALSDREWMWLDDFDAVHASPPCQAYSAMRVMHNARDDHPDLIEPTRELLLRWGGPFVIENVEQAPIEAHPPTLFGGLSGIKLCGSMFELWNDKYQLRRHRLFESNVTLAQPQCWHRKDRVIVGFYGDHARTRTRVRIDGNLHHARGTDITRNEDKLALVRDLMGIDWMTWPESNQAIPPAYTEFIGKQLLAALADRPALVGTRAGASDGALSHDGLLSTGTDSVEAANDISAGTEREILSTGSSRPVPAGRSPDCDRCGAAATQWSGAFGDPWVGWCSNACKNAWLNGDKGSVDRRSSSAQEGAE